MKKKAGIAAVVLLLFLLTCGCGKIPEIDTAKVPAAYEETPVIGMWITYSELSIMKNGQSGALAEFEKAMAAAKECGINAVFVHTRAFCDATYPSEIFPLADYCTEGFTLKEMIDTAHKYDIKFHAWVNPYRVSTSSPDLDKTDPESPVRIWLEDGKTENDRNVCFTEKGIFLNPASNEARKLILDGVREIAENYPVDGIHIDDYFYPDTNSELDREFYEEYINQTDNPLNLEEWRRSNVSMLVSGIYSCVKSVNNNILFGVSPAADIDKCYNTLYADIEGWIGGGYVDYIMPQLYFGFNYPLEGFRFGELCAKWLDISGKKVKLYGGLAAYKTGTQSLPDYEEWNGDTDILLRQAKLLMQNEYDGYVFFSYSSLFGSDSLQIEQRKNVEEFNRSFKNLTR